jgi:hypothetical protein
MFFPCLIKPIGPNKNGERHGRSDLSFPLTVLRASRSRIRGILNPYSQCSVAIRRNGDAFPSGWQVIHVDEEAEDINWTGQPDIVGITFHPLSAIHAYDLAARDQGLSVPLRFLRCRRDVPFRVAEAPVSCHHALSQVVE